MVFDFVFPYLNLTSLKLTKCKINVSNEGYEVDFTLWSVCGGDFWKFGLKCVELIYRKYQTTIYDEVNKIKLKNYWYLQQLNYWFISLTLKNYIYYIVNLRIYKPFETSNLF